MSVLIKTSNILDILIDDVKIKKSKKKSKVLSIITTHYPIPEDYNDYNPESDY